jgi:hypothetical protein
MPAKDYISGKNLPIEYEGFSIERLLELLKMRLSHQSLEGVSVEEIRAMDNLDRDFKLSPIFNTNP